MNALEIKNVTKKYKGFTLDNINFTLPSGCIMGLIGENGAGKSTLIKAILGMIKYDGTISVLGAEGDAELLNAKQDIGVVLDQSYFPDGINVKQVNSIMKNTYENWDENEFFGYIDKFSLPLDRAFKDYSRGMRMKLSMAVALSHKAKLLILDEPTGGLDPIVRDEIVDILYDYTRAEDHSVLMSSHILSDLEKLCDYIAFIHEGKLVFVDEKDALTERYGLVNCSEAEFEFIKDAAVGVRKNGYSVQALVDREKASGIKTESATLEEIIVFMVKGAGER
mgnify:FL=1